MARDETIKRIARGKASVHTKAPTSVNPEICELSSSASFDRLFAQYWRNAMDCRECLTLAPWRKFPPDVRGNSRSRIMILGEAPGRVSLDNRRPFSNPRNLMIRNAVARAIAPFMLLPEQILYFTDVVKCWPASKTGANRSPTTKETVTCTTRHLLRELDIIRPSVIFAFGARATSALLGNSIKLSQAHGSIRQSPAGARVIPLMHPSTINIAGMRRVGIKSLEDYERQLAVLFRREFALLQGDVDQPDETKQS